MSGSRARDGQPGNARGKLSFAIDGIASHVEQATKDFLADGDGDGTSRIENLDAPRQAVGSIHGNAADAILAQVLLHFQHQPPLLRAQDLERVPDLGQLAFGKIDVDDNADYFGNRTSIHRSTF